MEKKKNLQSSFLLIKQEAKFKTFEKWGLKGAKLGDMYALEVVMKKGNQIAFNFKKLKNAN